MKSTLHALSGWFVLGFVAFAGCQQADNSSDEKYHVVDTKTDETDPANAKVNAQDSLAANPNLGCMVGLFEYNPPMIIEAVRDAEKLGDVKIVGFDEADATLQGILDGHVHGTVVQDPYQYGYASIKILAGLARKDRTVLPEDGFADYPPQKITKENVEEFWDKKRDLLEKEVKVEESTDDRPRIAFVTNCVANFWKIAEKGAMDAGKEFNVDVEFIMPPDNVTDQKRMTEDVLSRGVAGIAISPVKPDAQQDFLNQVAEKTNLITVDSDAPDSKRLCYVGMDNLVAGRMCGELITEAMPEGGTVMLFIGNLDQDNAKRRREGVLEALKEANEKAKPKEEKSDSESGTPAY